MSGIPRGIPTVAYCRVLPPTGTFGSGDVLVDGNAVVIHDTGQPSVRFEVAQVLDRTLSDEQACELSFGRHAGMGVGETLNPVSAFVQDAANVVVLLVGSRATRKWQFLKRSFLPFLANEIVSTIAEKSQEASSSAYKAQLTLSACEIQDEIVCDLLRPGNRGLSVETTLEEGVVVPGLHRETVVDEATLRRLLLDACDNRAVQTLPVGGSIDTSSGIFEFRLYQVDSRANSNQMNSGMSGMYQSRECFSRLVVVDVPSVDPLVVSAQETRLLAGPTLHKSLFTFVEVAKKLNNPYRAQIAPFRASRLSHYLSELLGGNAVVVATAMLTSGEPAVSKKTMELLSALNAAQHYPIGARELSDTLRGLLSKYRAMLMHMQDDLLRQASSTTEQVQSEKETQRRVEELQRELTQALAEQSAAVEDRSRMFELAELLKAKYQAVLDEKLAQSSQLAEVEEDNLALAKTIVELNLQIATLKEQHEKERFDFNVDQLQKNTRIAALEEEVKEHVSNAEKMTEELTRKAELISGSSKEIAELQNQIAEQVKEIHEHKEKNIELGAELLTLVNHKDLMQEQHDKMKAEYDEMMRDTQDKRDKERALEDEVRRLLEKLLAKDEEVLDMRKQLMQASETAANARIESVASKRSAEEMQQVREELEAKKMQQEEDRRRYAEITEKLRDKLAVEQESLRTLQKERENLQHTLDDKERVNRRMQIELEELKENLREEQEERKRLIAELETKIHEEEELQTKTQEAVAIAESLKQKIGSEEREKESEEGKKKEDAAQARNEKIRRAIEAMKVSAQDKKEQQRQRREEELQRQVLRLQEDLRQETVQLKMTERELSAVQTKYRDLLQSSLLLKAPQDTENASIANKPNQIDEETSANGVDHSLKMLLRSFEERERNLLARNTMQSETNREVLRAYRELFDGYQDTVTGVESALDLLGDLKQLGNNSNPDVELSLKKQLTNVLQEKLSFSAEQLKVSDTVISSEESKLRRESEENPRDQMLHDIDSKERVAAMIGAYQMQLRQAEIKYTQLQQRFITQQLQLKQLLSQKNDSSGNGFPSEDAASNAQYDNLIAEIKELRKLIFSKDAAGVASRKPSAQLIQALRDAASSGSLPGAAKDDALPGKPSAPVRNDRERDELRTQLVAAESRAMQAIARHAALEEELKSYQNYMREIVPQYQRQIQTLQNELQRKKAAEASQSKQIASTNVLPQKSSDLKLPPIANGSGKSQVP